MTARIFVDTMVLAYAIGVPSERQTACRAIVAAAADQRVDLHISAEALQELLFHRMRRVDRGTAVTECRDVRAACVVHPIDEDVIDGMLNLVAATAIRGRDAVHAATALVAGFDAIVTTDLAFDTVPGLDRIDPREVMLS